MKIKAYRESVAEEGATGRGHEPLSAKRARKYTGVEAVEQELEALNREYKALLDQVLSYLNQLQDDETRMREFVSSQTFSFFISSFLCALTAINAFAVCLALRY